MSGNAAKIGGGVLAIVVAVGVGIAKNAESLFRVGARGARSATKNADNLRHFDDVARHLDDTGGIGRRAADIDGSGRLLGAEDVARGASDSESAVGAVIDGTLEGAGVAADLIGDDDE